MVLNFGAISCLKWRPCCRPYNNNNKRFNSTVCSASPSTTAEQLRQQLDSLQKEANSTRAKVSNSRARLMRLSEAAEMLRRQAAVNVQTGKEDDARELLFQKKKVMQAMEKLKNRIELFDELAAKLNGAISMKEDLLIGNMALDLDVDETQASSPVRVVSPKEEIGINSDDIQTLESAENQDLQSFDESQLDTSAEIKENEQELTLSRQKCSDTDDLQSLRESSPFGDFMRNLDQDLKKIEEELESFLRFSTLLIESKEKPEYSKVQHVMEILEEFRMLCNQQRTLMKCHLDSIPFQPATYVDPTSQGYLNGSVVAPLTCPEYVRIIIFERVRPNQRHQTLPITANVSALYIFGKQRSPQHMHLRRLLLLQIQKIVALVVRT